MDLKGKVVWITGGASGIGLATARAVLGKGSKVLITDKNVVLGEKVAAELGPDVLFKPADQTKPDEMIAAVEAAYEKWGRIDGLVNSAGLGSAVNALPITLELTSPTQFRYVVDMEEAKKGIVPLEPFMVDINIDLVGSFNAARIAAYYMVKNEPDEHGERGSMVMLSSMAADKYALGNAAGYAAAKAGVLGLSREIAYGCGSAGIRCNAILPGSIDTPLISIDQYPEEFRPVAEVIFADALYKQCFPGTKNGKPENIASMAVELLQNWFATGGEYRVDGGYRS
jgi:NAD(P)-dependent dehydrogenase (short-subunit alcohol dehydrogenase family)